MLAAVEGGAGRPPTACQQCRTSKVRCSREIPRCRRCNRLGNLCQYPQSAGTRTTKVHAPGVRSPDDGRQAPTPGTGLAYRSETQLAPPRDPTQSPDYLGIPEALTQELIKVYFSHVYNAHLLLHEGKLAEDRAAGLVPSHVLFSICAWGALFYRDNKGRAPLVDHGFAREWAKRAGKLVLNEIETPHENNIVTCAHLSLFWYTRGSWRRSYIHKGNAMQTAHILNLAGGNRAKGPSLEAELSRRRFWACYLINCHSSESMFAIDSPRKLAELPLPWHDTDYKRGSAFVPAVTFGSHSSNGSTYAEMIRAMAQWSSVNSLINNPDTAPMERIGLIHQLDAKVKSWWATVPETLHLSGEFLSSANRADIPKFLLINIVYHQCLCALHSSIVPLFSWGPKSTVSGLSQQLSAQAAYESSCAISELLDKILNRSSYMSDFPSFVGFAAYCSFAVQIPFKWCLNGGVRERAKKGIATNLAVIRGMARHWRSIALLEKYAEYLTGMHMQNQPGLDGEPKVMSSNKLAGFSIEASSARASILSMNGILWKEDGTYSREGDELTVLQPDTSVQQEHRAAETEMTEDGALVGDAPASFAAHNMSFGTGNIDNYATGDLVDFFQPILNASSLFHSIPDHFEFDLSPGNSLYAEAQQPVHGIFDSTYSRQSFDGPYL